MSENRPKRASKVSKNMSKIQGLGSSRRFLNRLVGRVSFVAIPSAGGAMQGGARRQDIDDRHGHVRQWHGTLLGGRCCKRQLGLQEFSCTPLALIKKISPAGQGLGAVFLSLRAPISGSEIFLFDGVRVRAPSEEKRQKNNEFFEI